MSNIQYSILEMPCYLLPNDLQSRQDCITGTTFTPVWNTTYDNKGIEMKFKQTQSSVSVLRENVLFQSNGIFQSVVVRIYCVLFKKNQIAFYKICSSVNECISILEDIEQNISTMKAIIKEHTRVGGSGYVTDKWGRFIFTEIPPQLKRDDFFNLKDFKSDEKLTFLILSSPVDCSCVPREQDKYPSCKSDQVRALLEQIEEKINNGYSFQRISIEKYHTMYRDSILKIFSSDAYDQETLDNTVHLLNNLLKNLRLKSEENQKILNNAEIRALLKKSIFDGFGE